MDTPDERSFADFTDSTSHWQAEILPDVNMRLLLNAVQMVAAVVFGGCVGFVAGLVLCLALRDSPTAFEMPLERIVAISSVVGAAGSLLFGLLEWRRIARPAPPVAEINKNPADRSNPAE